MNYYLSFAVFTLALLCLTSCGPAPKSTPAPAKASTPARSKTAPPAALDPTILRNRTFHEAPMLAAKVARGELPPVADRLPENPLVVVPMEEIGRYGGTIRRVLLSEIENAIAATKTLNENLMGYHRPLPTSIDLSLAESYEFNDEGNSAIFHLRKGIRWSDGAPFTVDDILFWYYDMTVDEDARFAPIFPGIWLADGEPIKLEKLDDYTLKVSSPLQLGQLLTNFCEDYVAYPRHILAPFHPRYNPKADYEDFRSRTTEAAMAFEPGTPRLSAWYPAEWLRGQKVVYDRNPYYWKVDTAGNQLPYADHLQFDIIREAQMMQLKFANGEFDLFGRHGNPNILKTLSEAVREGRVKLHLTPPKPNRALFLNWDTPDSALRQAFRDRQVRLALSLALNRTEISEVVFNGLLVPCGTSYTPDNPYYSEKSFLLHSEHDPAAARRLLDRAGYLDSDGDGIREFKNGKPFNLTLDVGSSSRSMVDMCELVIDYWAAVGIKVYLNAGLEDIIYARRINGTFDVQVASFGGADNPLAVPQHWAIVSENVPFWHKNASQEGPEWLWEVTRNIQRAMVTVDPDELRTLMVRVRDLYAENVPVVVIGAYRQPWAASTRLGNVPETVTGSNLYRGWSRPLFHEQLFIKNP